MPFEYTHYDRIDLWNGVSHSVSRVNPFIMRIYFAHVSRLIVLHETLFSEGVLQYLAAANGNNGIPVHISP